MKNYTSLAEIQQDLGEHQISCVDLVKQYLERIEEHKSLNAFLEVFEQSALQKAAEVDEKLANGTAGQLAGMVMGLKDNICYHGHVVTASSKILDGFESLYSATVVERLVGEDAIVIGRLNCDEFAMGSSNENSSNGHVLHPIDNTKVPGGSSGGSAVAVSAGLCLTTLGSDTGGSIRQPASFCGTVGLKPTYGRVSRYGLIAYASSFDQIGVFGNNIKDVALVTQVMSGKDEHDSTSSAQPVPAYAELLQSEGKKRITYFKSIVEHPALDPEIKSQFLALIEQLKSDGHEVESCDFPFLDYMVPTYYVLTTAEASSNLARFDGIHYGYRSNQAVDLQSTYKLSRTEGFGPEVKRRIMLGTYVLSAGYYDAYYAKGQKVRRVLKNRTEEIMADADFIISPTTPHTAFGIGEQNDDPIKMYLEDIFTVHANLCGLPAVSLPMGQHSNGLPFGIQLTAKAFAEDEMLAFSQGLMNMAPLAN